MKIGMMFSDVANSLLKKPATERYPIQRYPTPVRLRATLVWNADVCTGCGLCAMDCPARAIEMHVIDKKAKRFVMEYHIDRCTFCAQCVHSCRQGGLSLSNDTWELAGYTRESFLVYYGDPEDVQIILSGKNEIDEQDAESG